MIKNRKNEHHHWIPHIRISFGTKIWKSEHDHGIRDIWINVNTKFQLKLLILNFLTKCTRKRYDRPKQPIQQTKRVCFCIGNINSMIVFEHFRDLKNLIILNILKEKLVNSCLYLTFTNVGNSPKTLWLFFWIPLIQLCKISRPYLVQLPNYWTWTRSSPPKIGFSGQILIKLRLW